MGRVGRPKGKVDVPKKSCLKCTKEKRIEQFYASCSPLHSDNRIPFCKDCLKDMANPKDIQSVKDTLRSIDRPFIDYVWEESIKVTNAHPFGVYMKNIAMPQFRELTWADSKDSKPSSNFPFEEDEEDEEMEVEESDEEDEFKLTRDIVDKWGSSYKKREYMHLEKFYDDMMSTHDISTPQHKKLLILMCKLQLKMDKFLEDDMITEFSKLHSEYQKLLQSSGFRPIDKISGADAYGVTSFAQIVEFVEKKGFIKPVKPEVDPDKLDKSIQYMLTYQRRLHGLSALEQPPEDLPWNTEEGEEDGEA